MNNKYLIISGCSYAFVFPEDLPFMIEPKSLNQDVYDKFKIIKLGSNSAGNEFIVETTMITVQHLLDIGVNPKDICVINNFTQIYRPIFKVPPEYFEEASKLVDDNTQDIRYIEGLEMKSIGSLIKLKKEIYSFLSLDWYLKGNVKKWYEHQVKTHTTQKTVHQHFETYLSSIVVLQSFLKRKGVFGIHFLMNNVFEGWDAGYNHIYSYHGKPTVPNTKNKKHISEISDYCKVLWESIDLDMFSFYSKEDNTYGGIDEYMIDNFCERQYMQNEPVNNFYFGNHPQKEVYIDFANKFMMDKIIKWYNND